MMEKAQTHTADRWFVIVDAVTAALAVAGVFVRAGDRASWVAVAAGMAGPMVALAAGGPDGVARRAGRRGRRVSMAGRGTFAGGAVGSRPVVDPVSGLGPALGGDRAGLRPPRRRGRRRRVTGVPNVVVALLSGRDDEFVATVLLGYTGMWWGERSAWRSRTSATAGSDRVAALRNSTTESSTSARQPGLQQLLSLLGALSAFRLCPPEEVGQLRVAVTLGVLAIGLQPQGVAQSRLREPDDVVVLVLRTGRLTGLTAARRHRILL